MMRKVAGLAATVLVVAGCGGSREDLAVDACGKAVGERLAPRTAKVDAENMRANTKATGESGFYEVTSTVVLDAGLSGETTQNFLCRAQYEGDASEPKVTFVQFW